MDAFNLAFYYGGYGMGASAMYWILFIGIAVVSFLVQANLKSKFKRYSEIPSYGGMTGKEIAEKMLHDNGIYDVKVVSTDGILSDHYNPETKTVNLSEDVYSGRNIAAASVAAHECGHAVQHAFAYGPLQLRSSLVPVVSFSSKWMTWVLLAGMLVISYTGSGTLLLIGIILFALTTLFSFVTLPVEIDASRRAVAWLDKSGMTDRQTHAAAVDALRSAAYTYVVAALSSLATLLYYISIFLGGRRSE